MQECLHSTPPHFWDTESPSTPRDTGALNHLQSHRERAVPHFRVNVFLKLIAEGQGDDAAGEMMLYTQQDDLSAILRTQVKKAECGYECNSSTGQVGGRWILGTGRCKHAGLPSVQERRQARSRAWKNQVQPVAFMNAAQYKDHKVA